MPKPTLFERLKLQAEEAALPRALRYSPRLRAVLLGCTVVLCGLFFPWHFEQFPPRWTPSAHTIGSRWQGPPLYAEYPFVVYKPAEQYERQRREAMDSVPPVFLPDATAERAALEQLRAMLDSLRTGFLPLRFDNSILWSRLTPAEHSRAIAQLQQVLEQLLRWLYRAGVLDIPLQSIPNSHVLVQLSAVEHRRIPVAQLLDSSRAFRIAVEAFAALPDQRLRSIGMELFERLFRPNLFYSAEHTERLRQAAAAAVPRTLGFVRAGELIVAPGDLITDTLAAKLWSYPQARLLQPQPQLQLLLQQVVGNFGHAGLVCAILFVYLAFLRRRIFRDNWQLAGLSSALVLTAAMSWGSLRLEPLPAEYLILLPAVSMAVAILLDSRTAFYTTVTAALLVAGVRGGDYSTGVALMLGGMLAAYTVRDIESRAQLFRSMFFIAVGLVLAIVLLGIGHGTELRTILLRSTFALGNAVVSPIATFGVLLLLERFFNITTDMQLQQYTTLEHPLLQELQQKAPGTYQHSLNVAHLAEMAARAIGARTVLVRVGAYFHDIGKLTKPEYFAENQIGLDNKHDRLPPHKSAAIIREHVTEGIELARAYRLPPQIVDLIPQHHGTMLIRAFWNKALEQARRQGTPPPSEEDFRYPGPKPQTKEAAILMLADAAEALSHVIPHNEPEALAAALDRAIHERILDGQFDECPLSFRELRRVRDALLNGLRGLQHPRVAYEQQPAQ
jgi:putative nucleotidyltransferase with HDIG domain